MDFRQFMEYCEQRSEGATLHDLLTETGFNRDAGERRAMTAQVARALINDDRYRALLGTKIFPSYDTRANWAEGVTRKEDRLDRPTFSSSLILSKSIDPVLDRNDFRFTGERGTKVAIQSAASALARGSKRAQNAVATAIVRQHDELDYAKEHLALIRDRLEDKDQIIADLRAANAALLAQNAALIKHITSNETAVIPIVKESRNDV
jgi:hypothetical protein